MDPQLTLTDWTWEPTVLAGLIALIAVYVTAWRRGWLRPSDDLSAWGIGSRARPVFFAVGVLVAFLALCSPIDRGGDEFFFWVHMAQHLMLMMIAPPFVLLGIAGIRPAAPDRFSLLRRGWTAITRPWSAVLIFNATLVVWHIPQLYNGTLRLVPLHVFEHLTFVIAGAILWWPIVDAVRGPGTVPVSPVRKVAILTVSGVPATTLGLLFSLASRPFYDFYAAAPRLWGVSAITDQQWAGAVMFGAGNLIFFVPISIIFLRMFGDPGAEEDELEAARHSAAHLAAGDVSGRSRTVTVTVVRREGSETR